MGHVVFGFGFLITKDRIVLVVGFLLFGSMIATSLLPDAVYWKIFHFSTVILRGFEKLNSTRLSYFPLIRIASAQLPTFILHFIYIITFFFAFTYK